jgi:signal transduction histidine kinase
MTDSLRRIRGSAKQMDALLRGLLKLSRLGRAALSVGSVDMNELMAELSSSLQFQVREAGATLRVGALPACRGDAVQLTQVFSNLLGNALKYLDPERPGEIAVEGRIEQDRAVYLVRDNGIGIAPQHQEKIFQLFHRLNPSANEGEGLGLTIVRQILGRLDGEVVVESTLGTGSTFTITLPAASKKGE